VGGEAQSGIAGKELPDPLKARVVDDKGNPVPGHLVNFKVTAGGGSVFAGASLSNADGIARERWTLGTKVGIAQTLEARAVDSNTGAAIVYATFSATVLPDVPAAITIVAGDQQIGLERTTLAVLQAAVADRYGNPLPSFAVAWSSDNGGSIDAPPATDPSAFATAMWTLGPGRGTQTATLRAGSASAQFHAFSRAYTVLATGLDSADNLIVDQVRAYWTEGISPALAMRSVELADPSPQTLVSNIDVQKMVVDDGGVYWSDATGIHVLDEANLDAGARDLIDWSQVDAGTPSRVFAISGGTVYLITNDCPSTGCEYRLEGFPRGGLPDGRSPDVIASVSHSFVPGTNSELVVDDRNAFWNSWDPVYRSGVTYSSALDGGPASLFTSAIGKQLVLDRDYLYGEQPKYYFTIDAVPLTATPSHPPPPAVPSYGNFAVDSSSIYWNTGGAVYATDFADGGMRWIDPGNSRDGICCLAIDATHVYWFSAGQLRKVPK